MICPQCRSADCFRSRRAGPVDLALSLIGLKPWRCLTCEFRFYASRVAVSFFGYAHCGRCGNFDLEHIARNRVQNGTLLFAKRFLGFPAYRCDPCREKFYSLRPFRRILPSMISSTERKILRS
jgi:hypothetical protein